MDYQIWEISAVCKADKLVRTVPQVKFNPSVMTTSPTINDDTKLTS